MMSADLSRVLFIPHGAGPLPLLGDQSHQALCYFFQNIRPRLGAPASILVVSAHWEAPVATVTGNQHPQLLYDYQGFPQESYTIQYPVPGAPNLASEVLELLQQHGIQARIDIQRGLDHGVFVPLKLLFPEADLPCVQLSLLQNLQPQAHINLGKALAALRTKQVLIIGSGFSFHNLGAFFTGNAEDSRNDAFQDWLIATLTNMALSESERETHLVNWMKAPFARYCHPREEHLLPLLVCQGVGQSAAQLVFDGLVAGKRACALLW